MRLPIRGGNWNNGANAGVFALNFNNPRSNVNANIGFRAALPSSQMSYAQGHTSSATVIKGPVSSVGCGRKILAAKENQEAALQMAVDKAAMLMTAEARAFLEKAYGDLNAYLVSRIEAEVRVQKQQANIITLGEPFTAELNEAPDVTAVAAATAAATAAVVVQGAIPQTAPISGPDSPREGGAALVV